MKNVGLDKVEEAKASFSRPGAGGYVAKVTLIDDMPQKEYLWIELDIAEGEFKDYYTDLYKARAYWGLNDLKSYKESALPFFKGMITAFEQSNPGFKFNYDEQTLKGKLVGIVLGEEEYERNNGEIGTKLKVKQYLSADKIRKGDFKVPPKKTLNRPAPVLTETTEDLPFEFN